MLPRLPVGGSRGCGLPNTALAGGASCAGGWCQVASSRLHTRCSTALSSRGVSSVRRAQSAPKFTEGHLRAMWATMHSVRMDAARIT